ncbi:hypothetical protein MBLNU13_g07331t1 [Cladosporium sp. NU13]
MPTMPSKPSIKEVEAQLGFNFKSGLSVDQRVKEQVETLDLFNGINNIKETYKTIIRSEIYSSEDVRRDAEELFKQLGPKLWPDYVRTNSHPPAWLFYPGKPRTDESPLRELYPRPLFFSNQKDRSILSQHFYDMICWKIRRYTERHRATLSPATSSASIAYTRGVKGRNVDSLRNAIDYAESSNGVDDDDEDEIIFDFNDYDDDPEGSYQPDSRSSDLSSLNSTPRPADSAGRRIVATTSSQKTCSAPRVPASQRSNPLPSTGSDAGHQQKPRDKRAADDDSGDEASQGSKRKHRQTNTPSYVSTTGVENAQQSSVAHLGLAAVSHNASSSQDARVTLRSVAAVQGWDILQKKPLQAQTHQRMSATPVAVNAAARAGLHNHVAIGTNDTATKITNGRGHDLISGATITYQNSHPNQDPAQLPEANREYDVRKDTAASASATAGDAESVEDTIVVQHSTPVPSSMMNVTSSTQREVSSDSHNFQALPSAVVYATASQPRLVLRGSALSETEMCQATTPTRLIDDASNEPGLQDTVNQLNTTTSPADKNINTLKGIFFRLYLDEDTDPLEPQCCVKLTGLTTRDELFKMMDEDLEDDLDTGDKIVAVRVKRADGKIFPGPNVLTMPIKRVGQQDMWRELIGTLLEHGAGEEGLRGYVKVKKSIDAK